jgi:hypothetical protein
MVNRRQPIYLRWVVAVVVTLLNISVFCIWIPAQLQISEDWIHVNAIWDRIEKVIFCLIDVALNSTFMYLVYTKLIAAGFEKYRPLFNYNAVMVLISLSMDVSLSPSASPQIFTGTTLRGPRC